MTGKKRMLLALNEIIQLKQTPNEKKNNWHYDASLIKEKKTNRLSLVIQLGFGFNLNNKMINKVLAILNKYNITAYSISAHAPPLDNKKYSIVAGMLF